jgi:hypothetical protein
MAVGDWRAGRLVRAVLTQSTVVNATSVSLPAARQRVGLAVEVVGSQIPATGSVTITAKGVSIAALVTARQFRKWTMIDDGELPTFDWLFSNSTGGTIVLATVELFVPESYLAQNLDSYARMYGA